MTNQKRTFGLLMTTMLSASFFTACSPQGIPTLSQGTPQVTQLTQNNSTQLDSTQANTKAASTTPVILSTSQEMQDSLLALHEEESVYNDSLSIAQDDGGFSTQMLDDAPLQAQVSASLAKQHMQKKPKKVAKRIIKNKAQKQVLKAQFKMERKQLDRFIKNAKGKGAIKINNDRIMIIDKTAFKQGVKDDIQAKKEKFKRHLAKHDSKLKLKKQLAKAKLKKLKRQNQTVRTSDKVTTQNEDGSTTETMKIHFENERAGLTRDITMAKTTLDGKPLKIEFQLEAQAKKYTRTVSRMVTFNEDGSKHAIMESLTQWENGKSREVHQERILNADGSGSGTGTMTLTSPDGKVKTHQVSTTINANGELSSEASNPEENTDVTLEETAEGDATVTVDEGEDEVTEIPVDIAEEAEEEATGEETPAEETPAEETPAEETPAEETPAEETPAEETPAEETPAEETPVT